MLLNICWNLLSQAVLSTRRLSSALFSWVGVSLLSESIGDGRWRVRSLPLLCPIGSHDMWWDWRARWFMNDWLHLGHFTNSTVGLRVIWLDDGWRWLSGGSGGRNRCGCSSSRALISCQSSRCWLSLVLLMWKRRPFSFLHTIPQLFTLHTLVPSGTGIVWTGLLGTWWELNCDRVSVFLDLIWSGFRWCFYIQENDLMRWLDDLMMKTGWFFDLDSPSWLCLCFVTA